MTAFQAHCSVLLVGVFLSAACSGPSAVDSSELRRIAILPIENLTGDASLDWVATAAPVVLRSQLAGTNAVGFVTSSNSQGYLQRTNYFLQGYFEERYPGSPDELHFELRLEDAVSHTVASKFAVDAPLVDALNQSALWLDAAARPFSSQNPQALAAWASGDPQHAVELDPGFGLAWLDLSAAQIAGGQVELALTTTAEALMQAIESPLDRLQLERVSAALRQDQDAEYAAVQQLALELPNDPAAIRQAAELSMARREFSESATHYRRLMELDPAEPTYLNLLGYALFFAGDLPAARQMLDRYAENPQHHANALDSQGEVLFMAGQFTDAERYFVDANTEDPNLTEGGDVEKAAYSRWLAGDLQGADELFAQFLAGRTIVGDEIVGWREASWEYATGRENQARARLESMSAASDTTLANLARQQLAVWANPDALLPQDLPTIEQMYRQTPPFADGLARTLYAEQLLEAGDRDGALALAKLWPLPTAGEPLLQSLTLRRYLALRQRLGLE